MQKLYASTEKYPTLTSQLIESIGKIIRYQEMEIRVGFSMVVQNSSDRHIFLYAAKAKAFFKIKLSTEDEYQEFVENHFESLTYNELLNTAFNKTIDSQTFQKSGYRPKELVALNLWITK